MLLNNVFELLDWFLKLVFSPLRRNFSSTVLSPPFSKNQLALMHKERQIVRVKARGKADQVTFSQIFSREDYSLALINRLQEVNDSYREIVNSGQTPLVLDIGANIGLSSVYFKLKFPDASVVAIEPEGSNFELLQKMGVNYGFQTKRAGLASIKTSLEIVDPGLGQNGFRTKVLNPGAQSRSAVEGISLDELSQMGEGAIPFILKIDIEGAEKLAFQSLSLCLPNYKLICIEPHDWMLPGEGGMVPFLRQISMHNFDFVVRGENVFFINNQWKFGGA